MKLHNISFALISFVYIALGLFFAVFSYGFVDGNLILSEHPLYALAHEKLALVAYGNRAVAGSVYLIFVFCYFGLYVWLLKNSAKLSISAVGRLLVGVSLVLALSYSAVSYDVFNYIATAKVTFTHRENPYIIMPIDIPNDPNLAFTRAANKVALYGPTWIVLSAVPHMVGFGNVWITMIMFKLFIVFWLWVFAYLLWRITHSLNAVIFFAFNPLVLIELGVAGHNDIVMVTLVVGALMASRSRNPIVKIGSWLLGLLSVGVKGATILLVPFMSGRFDLRRVWQWAFWIMLGVFVLIAPLREELYPWYAVWFLPFAAILYSQKRSWQTDFAIAFTLGLELRHIPYMVMGYYEGPGPWFRFLLTITPMVIYAMYWALYRKAKAAQS